MIPILLVLAPVIVIFLLLVLRKTAADIAGISRMGHHRFGGVAVFQYAIGDSIQSQPIRALIFAAHRVDGGCFHPADHDHAGNRGNEPGGGIDQDHLSFQPGGADHAGQHGFWHDPGCPGSDSGFHPAADHAGHGIFILHRHRPAGHWI